MYILIHFWYYPDDEYEQKYTTIKNVILLLYVFEIIRRRMCIKITQIHGLTIKFAKSSQ
jgi:hypothetical protein